MCVCVRACVLAVEYGRAALGVVVCECRGERACVRRLTDMSYTHMALLMSMRLSACGSEQA